MSILMSFYKINSLKTVINKCIFTAPSNVLFSKNQELVEKVLQWDTSLKKQNKTSKAMTAYLTRAREYDEFMKKEQFQYKTGKRHLANMMGEDPENFTQKDVDRAIEYLFPSGIYDQAARPLMKPPEEVFPAKKEAEFDKAGRPHHYLFYTGKANYFQLLYDIVDKMEELYKFEDAILSGKKKAVQGESVFHENSNWIPKDQLEKVLMEKIDDIEYEQFKNAMERLVALPYSNRHQDFILKFRKVLAAQKFAVEIPKPYIDANGKAYVTVNECLRKSARGSVTVKSPGTGKLLINGNDLSYFKDMQSREQVLFPLIFTGLQDCVDVECSVSGGGPTGQSGAMRWGIAWALRSFVDNEMLEKMQIAGLLTRDHRRRERKKVGMPGARKKPTWKKR